MRTLITIIFLLGTLTTFGQKNIKKAYILVDGKPITYKEYKQIDPTKFAEIKVSAGNDELVGLFGKKAKDGIVHLKSSGFLDNQHKLLDDLINEFKENRIETTLLIINGIPYDRSQISNDRINKLNYETVELIAVPENTGTTFNHKRIIVIQTNVDL
jgi:hypothetical protein